MFLAIRKRLEDRDEGFTLIELLVVVIIIGILAAVAIPTFLNQRQRGYQAEAESDARNAGLMQESYYTDNDHYTGTLTDLTTEGYTGSAVTIKLYDGSGTTTTTATASKSFCVTATVEGETANYSSTSGGLVTVCP